MENKNQGIAERNQAQHLTIQLDGEVQNLVRRRRSPTGLTGGGISFGSGFTLGSGLGLAGYLLTSYYCYPEITIKSPNNFHLFTKIYFGNKGRIPNFPKSLKCCVPYIKFATNTHNLYLCSGLGTAFNAATASLFTGLGLAALTG